jgi:hypothetical protein
MANFRVITEAGGLVTLCIICLFDFKIWGKTPHILKHHTDIIWYYTTKLLKVRIDNWGLCLFFPILRKKAAVFHGPVWNSWHQLIIGLYISL